MPNTFGAGWYREAVTGTLLHLTDNVFWTVTTSQGPLSAPWTALSQKLFGKVLRFWWLMLAARQVLAGQADAGPKLGRWRQMAPRWAAPSPQAPSSPQCQPPNLSLFFPSLQLIFTMRGEKKRKVMLFLCILPWNKSHQLPQKTTQQMALVPCARRNSKTSRAAGRWLKSHA